MQPKSVSASIPEVVPSSGLRYRGVCHPIALRRELEDHLNNEETFMDSNFDEIPSHNQPRSIFDFGDLLGAREKVMTKRRTEPSSPKQYLIVFFKKLETEDNEVNP